MLYCPYFSKEYNRCKFFDNWNYSDHRESNCLSSDKWKYCANIENENPTNADEQYKLGCYCNEKGSYLNHQYVSHNPTYMDTSYDDLQISFEKKAFYWFSKSAEQGHAEAQYEVGMRYTHGRFDVCKPNKETARYWLTKAAEQGHKRAKDDLDNLDTIFAEANKGKCYVATCIYGSYDCSEVWTLRRYRDFKLSNTWFGRLFIQIYYTISPKIVELFGKKKWFNKLWKPILNTFVRKLQNNGIDNSPYLGK